MSIEAMYPSRTQPRSQNPLFARKIQRQKLGLMLILAAIGIGLLLIQLLPITAHADAGGEPVKATNRAAVEPIKMMTQDGKPVRQIQIYEMHGTSY